MTLRLVADNPAVARASSHLQKAIGLLKMAHAALGLELAAGTADPSALVELMLLVEGSADEAEAVAKAAGADGLIDLLHPDLRTFLQRHVARGYIHATREDPFEQLAVDYALRRGWLRLEQSEGHFTPEGRVALEDDAS
jgi:hypothetical protein